MTEEKINHPKHYGGEGPFEVINIIEDWGLGFSGGNALKYILRAPHKGAYDEDLKKALWYLRRASEKNEGRHMQELDIEPESVARFWCLDRDFTYIIHDINRGFWEEAWERLNFFIRKKDG